MSLTYSLLLKLNRGRAAIVENLSAEEMAALRVDTPVTQFLQALPGKDQPRHVFLTGNAGDGKTFAVRTVTTADPKGFKDFACLLDAAGVYEEGEDPVASLAKRLEAGLSGGKRLLVAVNRGQLERLQRHLDGAGSALREIVDAAVAQLHLAVVPGQPTASTLTLDLGLVDTLADEVIDPLISKAVTATDGGVLSQESAAAFAAAKAELAEPQLRDEIRRALDAVRADAVHVTMRQLWGFMAYLLTGWRPPKSTDELSVRDSAAARLYSVGGEHRLHRILRERADPALTPLPNATGLILRGEFEQAAARIPTLAPYVATGGSARGSAALRVAATYKIGDDPRPQAASSSFARAVSVVREEAPGWIQMSSTPRDLLRGIYRELSMPPFGNDFPQWQHLCYDARRADEASLLADSILDLGAYRLAVPRPSQVAEEAFGHAWAPPVILLAAPAAGGGTAGGELRLRPAMFDRLLSTSGGISPLPAAELEVLRRWLVAQTAVSVPGGEIRFARRAAETEVTTLQEKPLEGNKLSFT